MTENTIKEQLRAAQAEQFAENMKIHTMLGNITHWRPLKDNSKRVKIMVGRTKIFNLLSRFKV